MKINCTMKSEKALPSELKEFLKKYYFSLTEERQENGAEQRWHAIQNLPSALCYKVLIDDVLAGWVIVDTHRSTIIELCLLEGYGEREIETHILDRMIELHKLIALELPKGDTGKIDRKQLVNL